MEERKIEFDTATLAKRIGFDVPVTEYYMGSKRSFTSTNPENHNEEPITKEKYSRPTQALLQKWIREVEKVRVFPEQKTSGMFGFKIYIINPEVEKRAGVPWIRIPYFTHNFQVYEDALEAGLIEALRLIGEI